MAELKTNHRFTGSLGQVFEGIRRYAQYPEYLPGVTEIEISEPVKSGSSCQIKYTINLIKTFYYVLDMFEEKPNKIWWTMSESNIMKTNSGSWELHEDGDGVKADYKLDISFRGLVPKVVTDKVAKANLPAMFDGFQKLIDDTANV